MSNKLQSNPYKQWYDAHGMEEAESGIIHNGVFYAYGETVYIFHAPLNEKKYQNIYEGKKATVIRRDGGIPFLEMDSPKCMLNFQKDLVLIKEQNVPVEWFEPSRKFFLDDYSINLILKGIVGCLFCLLFNDFWAGWGFIIFFVSVRIISHWYGV